MMAICEVSNGARSPRKQREVLFLARWYVKPKLKDHTNMFQIIKKIVKVLNVSWTEKATTADVTAKRASKVGEEIEVKDSVPNVTVTVQNCITVDTLLGWMFAMFGIEAEEVTDEVKGSDEFKSLEGVVRLVASQLKQHEASTATRQKAVEFCQGKINRAELDAFVYVHDYTKTPKEKGVATKERAMQLLGLTPEELAMLAKLREAKNGGTESDDSDDAGE